MEQRDPHPETALDLAGLYYTVRRLRAFVDEALTGTTGASAPLYQQMILRVVLEDPGMTLGDVAKRASVAQSLVSRFLPIAVENGLLRTEADARDRRRVLLFPGDGLVSQFSGRLATEASVVLAPLLDQLPARERQGILRTFEQLHALFKAAEAEAATGG